MDVANVEKDDLSEEFVPHQIFLNHVDAFNSRYIAAYLSDQYKQVARDEPEMMGEGEEGALGEEAEQPPMLTGEKFRIIGTLEYDFHKPSEDIAKVIHPSDENFDAYILQCGFIIFDATRYLDAIEDAKNVLKILETKLQSIQAVGPKTFAQYNDVRVFILISSVFTWALTKPIDPEDPDFAFTEVDFKKRRCHPNYRQLIDFERDIVALGKKYDNKLKTYVICSGIIYGMEEGDLFFLFKLAWENETLPLFKPGNNYVPLIHIKDLIKVIHAVIKATPKKKYILAVEQTPCHLKSIIKALNKFMGNGKINEFDREEAFLLPYIKQRDYDCCTLNVKMEPAYIVEELEIEWQNEMNLAENMAGIINEFKTTRKLKPINIVIHGPPASGKTTLATYISDRYGNHYVSVKTMIDDTINETKELIEREREKLRLKEEETVEPEGGEEEDDDEGVDIEDLEQKVREIENTVLYSESKRLDEEEVTRLMKAFIAKNRIQNQGYVLDNYPKTTKQATDLFGGAAEGGEEQEEEDEGEEGGEATVRLRLLPDVIITMEVDDEYVLQRLMEKPEAEIQGTHNSEENILRRLETFRLNNTEDNTMLNYFNEREVRPVVVNVRKTPSMEVMFNHVVPFIGPTSEFGPTEEEERECQLLEDTRKKLQEEQQELEKHITEKKASEEYDNHMEEWNRLLEEMQMEEEKILVAQSEPLRSYLMKFVFPTLTKGLLEVAKRKPRDPVDFLAEYLFKENPEGRMFDPSYTRSGELIERKYKEQGDF